MNLTIQNLVTDKCTDVLSTEVIPFRFDPNIVDPKVVVGEFEVEKVLGLNGNRNKDRRYLRTNLLVKIRWTGYDESYDSWEPYSEIKGNLKFLEYCKHNNLDYLVNKQLFDDNELFSRQKSRKSPRIA